VRLGECAKACRTCDRTGCLASGTQCDRFLSSLLLARCGRGFEDTSTIDRVVQTGAGDCALSVGASGRVGNIASSSVCGTTILIRSTVVDVVIGSFAHIVYADGSGNTGVVVTWRGGLSANTALGPNWETSRVG